MRFRLAVLLCYAVSVETEFQTLVCCKTMSWNIFHFSIYLIRQKNRRVKIVASISWILKKWLCAKRLWFFCGFFVFRQPKRADVGAVQRVCFKWKILGSFRYFLDVPCTYDRPLHFNLKICTEKCWSAELSVVKFLQVEFSYRETINWNGVAFFVLRSLVEKKMLNHQSECEWISHVTILCVLFVRVCFLCLYFLF